jgi:hypothetical protein
MADPPDLMDIVHDGGTPLNLFAENLVQTIVIAGCGSP